MSNKFRFVSIVRVIFPRTMKIENSKYRERKTASAPRKADRARERRFSTSCHCVGNLHEKARERARNDVLFHTCAKASSQVSSQSIAVF